MAHRLLILQDSPDFGGHERMLLALLPGVLASPVFSDVLFCHPSANRRLAEELARLAPRLRTRAWPFVKGRGEPYLRCLRLPYRAAIRRLVREERPSVVLLVQGRIENLATPLAALPRRLPVASYVPMAHRLAEMGRRGAALGDRVRRALYRRPNAFIVPDAAIAAQIAAAGGAAPVTVAPNIVAPPPRTERARARDMLGLDGTGRIALLLGRLDPAQKGVDLLLRAVARAGDRLSGWTVLAVGDGPARAAVEQASAAHSGAIRHVPWTDRPDLYLSAADVLLMPSRWEGLPLVLLEAMSYGVPVLASPIDIARALLPPGNIADFATDDLPDALDRVTGAAQRAAFARAAEARLAASSLERSRERFVAGILSAL